MARDRLLLGVVVICASSLVGCKGTDLTSLFMLESDAAGRSRVVAGSLESVSRSTQGTLRQLGLQAEARQDGDTVRIASSTKSGADFTLVLTREKSGDSERTRLRIEWAGAPEDQTGFQILSEVATRGKS